MAPRLIAGLLLALSLLPVANLVPGGEADPDFWSRTLDQAYGLALCAGIGILVAFVVRARRDDARRRAARADGGGSPDAGAVDANPIGAGPAGTGAVGTGSAGGALTLRVLLPIAGAAFLLYAVLAQVVLSGRPLLIDEIVQVLQARWYAEGLLAIPTPPAREFFSILHLVDLGDLTFSQFPAGGPAMLALGALVGAEWLVGPAAGAIAVFLFGRLCAQVEPGASRAWHLGAVLLFALAPFGAFMFASHMNHVTTLAWLLGATVALGHSTRDDAPAAWGFVTGLCLGVAATIRPLDGALFALPAAAWLLWRARRGGRAVGTLLASGVGVALPLGALLWVNARTTGDPLLFGYDLLWGAGHGIGFHQSPWGPEHTPARGLELISLYLTRLSVHLLETPFPALLPAASALWWTRRLPTALDRYLVASGALLLVGYWAYWHDGNFLGPRFLLPLLPFFILWTARAPRVLAARFPALGGAGRARPPSATEADTGITGAHRAGAVPRTPAAIGFRAALFAGGAYALLTIVWVRSPQYRNGMTSMRVDPAPAAQAAGVHRALVLVKESWGAQLIVRMWDAGIPRSAAEVLYRNVDACRLELALAEVEREGLRGDPALARLDPLRADSSALVRSTRSPDFTQRMLPGFPYPPVCEARLAADNAGYAHFAPFRLQRDGNVYARWLPGREGEIARYFPDRPVFLLSRAGTDVSAPLRFTRLR